MTDAKTPRARLEEEVRISSRQSKPAKLTLGDKEVAGEIKPIAFDSLETILGDIGTLFVSLFKMGATLQGKASKPSPASTDTGGSTEGPGPVVADGTSVDSPKKGFEDLLQPDVFTKVGFQARDVIKNIVEVGTTYEWEELKKWDWLVSISLALEVIKYNVGPEVRAFLSEETKSLVEALLPVPTSTKPVPS